MLRVASRLAAYGRNLAILKPSSEVAGCVSWIILIFFFLCSSASKVDCPIKGRVVSSIARIRFYRLQTIFSSEISDVKYFRTLDSFPNNDSTYPGNLLSAVDS